MSEEGTFTYHERFIENPDGWRYRIFEQDAGIIAIEYQEWREKDKSWAPSESTGISGNKDDMFVLASELTRFVAEMRS